MKKNIAIITDIGFQKKELDIFFVQDIKKYFNVYVFDFTKVFNPKLYKIVKKKKIKFKNLYEISSFENFEKLFLSNYFVTTINHISNYELMLKINDFFLANKLSLTHIQNHYVLQVKKNFFQKIYNLFFSFLDKKRLVGKLRYLNFKHKNNFHLSNIFISGLKGLNDSAIGNQTKVIRAHSREYDYHLKCRSIKKNKNFKFNYSVFLDQYLPFHTDALIFKKFNTKVTKEKYYPALNEFFSKFEKHNNTKILIASHPKANYSEFKENVWYGRKFYSNKTYELIKNAEYVLCHQSTSLSYAIILNKPLIFLTSNEYMRSYDSFTVHGYAKYFKRPLFNIDDANQNELIRNYKKINREIYNKYMRDYIKCPGSPNILLNKIFINHFKKLS